MSRSLFLTLTSVAALSLVWTGYALTSEKPKSPSALTRDVVLSLGSPQPPKPSRIDYRRLDERLGRLMQQKAMVGLAVAMIEDGEIRFLKGYGETVAGSGEPVTPATVFRWASVSKGVASTMVAALAQEGKLSLDEPVARYAPSLRLPGGGEYKATVADLLSHRLGIVGHAYDQKLEGGADARMLRSSLAQLNQLCSPGECHAYQNVAYDAASEIVERATGLPYSEAVRQRLFAPLGMDSASATREGLLTAPSWARPHLASRKPVEVTDSYYRIPAAGGVNSSIKDLARWMAAQMGEAPRVLDPALLQTVHMPRVYTPSEMRRIRKYRDRMSNPTYGLGWRDYDYAGHQIVGHRGGVTGSRSLILFDPVRKSGVVALWNSATSQPTGIELEFMDMLYNLPATDWLQIDTPEALARAQSAVAPQGAARPSGT
jgi:beta-lactamase class C